MNTEQIAALIGALGIGTWAGNVIQKYIEAKNSENLKRMEGENSKDKDTIKDLEEDIVDLNLVIAELRQKASELETSLIKTNGNRAKAEQQLATINVAFDMIYTQLRSMIGDRADGQELLEQLKTYIDGNTNRNTT